MDFKAPYKRDVHLKFFQNQFLPEDFKLADEKLLDFKPDRIKSAVKIGEVPSLELIVLESQHESENDPRVSLSRETFRLLANYGKQRALVIFTSKNSYNFRLSLVTIDLKWYEGTRVQKEYSNPKRFSFFLGPDAKVHTPQEYLVKPGRVKNFEDLKKRFSIEVVNKDFYEKIASFFTILAGGKRGSGKKIIDAGQGLLKLPQTTDDTMKKNFAVRLIGRLIFCWFLKKKDLLPEKLLSLRAIEENKNYYHNISEPLFFEVLNTALESRITKYKNDLWGLIPFLNGGLFTPHEDDYYKLAFNGVSEHLNSLIVPDDWLKELFEVFETYNFTIDENTSIDVELSIEPEMLGRIFENLLAEINPETGETARKSTGSYYTPRPIVEYMVDESLKQYLLTETDLPEEKISPLLSYSDEDTHFTDSQKDSIINALGRIKVIDPACGSGAFPMGILQKILLILQKLDPNSQKWLDRILSNIKDPLVINELKRKIDQPNYLHKLGIIRDCIYGVDIQSIAVEISKLRCFLSLIVDEKVDDSKPNRGVEPLPNLEFKFVCANTLIGLPETKTTQAKTTGKKITEYKGQTLMLEDADSINELKQLRDEYLRSSGSEKKSIEEKFKRIQSKMFEHSLNWGGKETQTSKLSQWDPFTHESNPWFDPEWMFGIKDGFDIVIGNPPYIFSRENLTTEDKANYKKFYTLTQFKINLYILFIERSFNLINKTGNLAFIIPNNWLTLSTTSDLRYFILTKTRNINIVLNYEKVFETSSVDTCILIFDKIGEPIIKSYEWTENGVKVASNQSVNCFLKNKNFIISNITSESDNSSKLCEKINSQSESLSVFAEVKNGVQAYTVGEGTPIQTEFMKNNRVYHGNLKKDDTWVKYLDGVDVGRYTLGWSKQFIKYGKNLSRPRKHSLFKGERILVRQIPSSPPYCLNSCYIVEHAINDNNSMIIKVSNKKLNLKYILGLLNSKLISFWFVYTFGKLQRKIFPQFKVKELRIFPLKEILAESQLPFITLVDEILNITKGEGYFENSTKQSKVKELEAQIDQMVYKLYDLTPEEIAIIENR